MRMPAPVRPRDCSASAPMRSTPWEMTWSGTATSAGPTPRTPGTRARRSASPGASRTWRSDPARAVTGAPSRASARLTPAVRPGAAAMVSELRGGAGVRSAALECATPATAQSVAAASTRRRMQVHVTGRDPPVLPRSGTTLRRSSATPPNAPTITPTAK